MKWGRTGEHVFTQPGSYSDLGLPNCEVRFTAMNQPRQLDGLRPKRANNGSRQSQRASSVGHAAAADVSEFTYSDQRFVGYIRRAAPDTRMLAPGSEVISARSRDGTPMSSP